MRNSFVFLMVFGFANITIAQFNAQQIISTDADQPTSVFIADLNGDGYNDVLSASWNDDKIAWYPNTDGLGAFGSQQVITWNADGADCVKAFDLDGDGDIDVLSSSYNDNKVAWYENTDGNGTFGTQQIISTDLIYGAYVNASDLDGDGDLDVISASIDDDKIAWYENTDGLGSFGTQQIIANPDGPNCVLTADIDGDGDMDVIFDAANGNEISWCENTDGQGTFGLQQIIVNNISNIDLPSSVYAADIDGDNDIDIISSSINDNKIAWYENTDGQGTFGAQQIISSNANQARVAIASDFDNDGDIDVVSASWNDDKIAWYENTDGQGTFGPQQVITTSADAASGVYFGDLNNDTRIDLVSSSYNDNKIAWYENNGPLGLNENEFNYISIAPNPSTDMTTIKISETLIGEKLQIIDMTGKIMMDFSTESNTIQIDISELQNGYYIINVGNVNHEKLLKL